MPETMEQPKSPETESMSEKDLAFKIFKLVGYGKIGSGFGAALDRGMFELKNMGHDNSRIYFKFGDNEVTNRTILERILREHEQEYLDSLPKSAETKQ